MGSRSARSRTRRLASLAIVALLISAMPAAAAPGWLIASTANPTGAEQAYLDGVSCIGSPTLVCFAVGSYVSAQGMVRTLIERSTGTSWNIVASPNRPGSVADALVGVSCTSATSCFAVGNSQASPTSPALTLVERWNGLGWKVVSSPNPPQSTGSHLHGVSCIGPSRCYAVGDYTSGGTAGTTLIERWNGASWAIVPSANHPGSAIDTLAGVSCTAIAGRMSCFAVGSWSKTTSGSVFFTLTERFNGTGWGYVASPNVQGKYRTALNAVSCVSPTSCIAVGAWQHAPGASVSEHWNGIAWTIEPLGNPIGFTFSQLNSVSCVSATSCTAVGSWRSGSAPSSTLIAHWTGSAWAVISGPNPATSHDSTLAAISCVAAKCSAVGSYLRPPVGNPSATLGERNF
jgi:hypothetical protein